MKLVSVLSVLVLGLSVAPAQAQFDDQDIASASVECETTVGQEAYVFTRITAPFGGSWQDATVYSDAGAADYTVIRSTFGFEVRYTGADFDLNIDTFSTGSAKFYERYDAKLKAGSVETAVRCEFYPF